jgi:hypothetical protein
MEKVLIIHGLNGNPNGGANVKSIERPTSVGFSLFYDIILI